MHSEFLIKNEYLVLNFQSNLRVYEHNLLAYERDIRGCKFAPGVNLLPGANLHPGANCAHEHGLSYPKSPTKSKLAHVFRARCLCWEDIIVLVLPLGGSNIYITVSLY